MQGAWEKNDHGSVRKSTLNIMNMLNDPMTLVLYLNNKNNMFLTDNFIKCLMNICPSQVLQ